VSLSGALTAEQIRLFRHNGYLKLQDTLPADLVARLRRAIDADVAAAMESVVRNAEARVVWLSRRWAVAIDSLIFHRIGPNRTQATRVSITLGYRSVDDLSSSAQDKSELTRGERVYRGNERVPERREREEMR
jgi:hypothetical protein